MEISNTYFKLKIDTCVDINIDILGSLHIKDNSYMVIFRFMWHGERKTSTAIVEDFGSVYMLPDWKNTAEYPIHVSNLCKFEWVNKDTGKLAKMHFGMPVG